MSKFSPEPLPDAAALRIVLLGALASAGAPALPDELQHGLSVIRDPASGRVIALVPQEHALTVAEHLNRIGARSHAPPITPEMLAGWRDGFPQEPRIRRLCTLVETARAGAGQLNEAERLSMPLLNEWGEDFDQLQGEARAAAFHLLWYAKELALGRFPG